MMDRLLLAVVGSLVYGTQAGFVGSPIRSKNGVMMQGYTELLQSGRSPMQLVVKNPPERMSCDNVPCFEATSDKAIKLKGKDKCVEATGHKNGDTVRLNDCTGAKAQKWNWIPDGDGGNFIQIQDTNLCLETKSEASFNGFSVQLHECQQTEGETWKFEVPAFSSKESFSFDVRHFAMTLIALVGLGAVSVSTVLARQNARARAFAQHRGDTCIDEGGISLFESLAASQGATMTPAVMAVSPFRERKPAPLQTRSGDARMGSLADRNATEHVQLGCWNPLQLQGVDMSGQSDVTGGALLRDAEIRHGRVTMVTFVDHCSHKHRVPAIMAISPDSDKVPAVGKKMDAVLSATGAGMGIFLLSALETPKYRLYAPPLAAVAAILFNAPKPPPLLPVAAGTLGAASVSVIISRFCGTGKVARSLAVAGAMSWFKLSGQFFPPGAALAALFIDNPVMAMQGWKYPLFPCVTGNMILWSLASLMSRVRVYTLRIFHAWRDVSHSKVQPFSVGDLVERRDNSKNWGKGYVTSIDPLLVTYAATSPEDRGLSWDEVRLINA